MCAADSTLGNAISFLHARNLIENDVVGGMCVCLQTTLLCLRSHSQEYSSRLSLSRCVISNDTQDLIFLGASAPPAVATPLSPDWKLVREVNATVSI